MARPLRIEFENACYLIQSLGNRSEAIVRDDADRERFLLTLGEAGAKTGWRVIAYCLLTNEFHAVLRTPEPNLVSGMKWFLGSYTIRYNRRHSVRGHLFAGRYRSLLVDADAPGCLKMACERVHLRPLQEAAREPGPWLCEFPWSSARLYRLPPESRPGWLFTAALWKALDLTDDESGRDEFQAQLEQARPSAPTEERKATGPGWCLGGDEFRRQVLERVRQERGRWPGGTLRKEAAQLQAEALVQEALGEIGWSESALEHTAKGAAEKVAIARRLRRSSTVSLKWIARRLRMGSWTYLANLLYAGQRPAQAGRGARVVAPVPVEPRPGGTAEAGAMEETLPVYCL